MTLNFLVSKNTKIYRKTVIQHNKLRCRLCILTTLPSLKTKNGKCAYTTVELGICHLRVLGFLPSHI